MKTGERCSAFRGAVEASEHPGISVDSIRPAQWVSEKVPVINRINNLTWTHHLAIASLDEAIASLDAADQKRILREMDTQALLIGLP